MTTTTSGAGTPPAPPIGFLLRRLDQLITEHFQRTLNRYEATRLQWQLLNLLAAGGASVDDLERAVSLFLDRSTGRSFASELAPLVAAGTVDVVGQRYSITDKGHELLDSLSAEVRGIRELSSAGLSEEEYEQTVRSLQMMIHNLQPHT